MQVKGKAQAARIEKALAAIDKVHAVPATVPRVPIRTERVGREEAQYVYGRDGKPVKITVRAQTNQPGLAVLHEIGHLLDHQAHDTPGAFASDSPREFTPVLEALRSSRAFTEIENIEKAAVAKLRQRGASFATIADVRKKLAYVKDPKELWARAYCQHIAQKSGEPALLKELELTRARGPGVYIPFQWDDDDFAKIGKAIDAYMKARKWTS